jgi:hydrogenase-4 component B
MPLTALAFGIGAASLGGLPPLNGFASEWQTFHGLIGTAAAPLGPVTRLVATAAIGALALGAALGLAAAVKMTGVSFLALPRSDGAAGAHEPGRATLAALSVLATACVAGGLAAAWTGGVLGKVAATVLGAAPAPLPGRLVPVPLGSATTGAFEPLGVAVMLLAGVALVAVGAGLAARRRADRTVGPTWTCGIAPEPAFEYTATSFGKPVRLFFRRILQPVRDVRVDHHAGTPLPRSIHYRGEVSHVIEHYVYRRAHSLGVAAAQVVRRFQNGSLQLYIGYVLVTVVVLLVITR